MGKPKIVDERVTGVVMPPSKAHSASRYLSRQSTQETVMAALDRFRFQPVNPMTVARSLADALDVEATARVSEGGDSLQKARESVLEWIQAHVLQSPITAETVFLEDQLDRYVAVNLTRSEVETLAGTMGRQYGTTSPAMYRMVSNSRKKALMHDSLHTVQAHIAQLGYNACGQGITWAALDNGIDRQHPHFHNATVGPGRNDCRRAAGGGRRGRPRPAGDGSPGRGS